MKFIVEHMEDGMHEWCLLEYRHMIQICGADDMYFSGLTENVLNNCLPDDIKQAHCHREDVMHLPGVDPSEICLLDPSATEPLKPEDGEKFKYMLFGGILGDDPPRGKYILSFMDHGCWSFSRSYQGTS